MGMLEDFTLLEQYGFGLIPYKVAKNQKEAIEFAKELGYPVVLKVISEDISHKTDVGGVKVNIKKEPGLKIAYDEIIENTRGKKIDGVLVQKMARKGVELIIGEKKDPQFGHMVVLGLGGIYVEVFRDISARICPINEEDVEEMVNELKSHPIITGTRGRKPINMNSLKKILKRVCKMATEEDIKEMDLNPVVFDEKGCDIIDVRITR